MKSKDYHYIWIPNSQTTSTAQRIVDSLTSGGKKGKIESLVRSLWLKNGKSSKEADSIVITKQIKTFVLSATPFVGLQTRRRGKRPTTKILTISRQRGERKAITSLKKSMQQTGAVSQTFSIRMQRQLQALSTGASTKPRTSGGVSATREARDELHRQALQSRPAYWIR